MDYTALAAELTAGHPVTGAYSVDAATAAGELNAVNISEVRSFMTGSEIFALTDSTEFGGLTDAKRSLWVSFCGIDRHSPENNGTAHKFVVYIFGDPSDTLSNLASARTTLVSRVSQISGTIDYGGEVTISHVQTARGEI